MGVGKVVELPHKYRIRSYADILEGAENTEHMKKATAFYQGLEALVVKNRHTVDLWAYGLDQFGLLEMKSIVNCSGGLLAMHELFDHFIFRSSFPKFYESNEEGMFNFHCDPHVDQGHQEYPNQRHSGDVQVTQRQYAQDCFRDGDRGRRNQQLVPGRNQFG